MSLIKCAAVSCTHNSDCKCTGGKIAVHCCGGDCSPACCASYSAAKKKDASKLKEETGIMGGKSSTDTAVICQAAGCVHNKDDRCTCISINITQPVRSQGGKCFCDSFDPR